MNKKERPVSPLIRPLTLNWKRQALRVLHKTDQEAIHDLRVAGRRLKSALRAFPSLPAKIGRQIDWVIQHCATIRDLEVFQKYLLSMAIHGSEKKRETIIHSSNFISRDIETHQKRFAAALRSRRQARLFQDLRNLSGIPPRGRATLSLLAAGALRKSIKRVKKRARKVATNPSDRRLHRLRIALRILRYQCEFFESLDRVVLRRFSRRTVPLQRDLGHHQDATMSLTLLESRAGRHLPDFLEGAFRDSLEHTRRKTRKAFFRLWKDYWERSLPELEKMLERWRKRQVR